MVKVASLSNFFSENQFKIDAFIEYQKDLGDLNILQASYLLQIRKATFLILHDDDITIPPTYPILHDDDGFVIVKKVYPTPSIT